MFDAPQDAVCPLGCQGTLLTHIEPAVDQHPQIPFCRAALQPLLSQSVLVPGVTLSQMQNLTFVLVKFHAIDDCPMLQSIQVPLQGLLSLRRVNSTSQFGIVSKLANGAFNSCMQIIDQNIEWNWPQNGALGNTTGDRLLAKCSPIHYNPLSFALQPVLHPAHHKPTHPTVGQLVQKDAVRDSIKTLTKIQKNYFFDLPLN